MHTLEQQFLKPGHRLRPGGNFGKLSITIHSTGNSGSTVQNERDWLDNPTNDRDAAWHYVVGNGTVIQAIPDIERAWHCGEEVGNRFSIGVEIIETGDRRAVLETAAEFTAGKLKEYGLGVADVKRHFDWTGKNCPRILLDKAYVKGGMDWAWFLGQVKEYYEQGAADMEKVYNNLAEIPVWNQKAVKKLLDKGYLLGNEKGELGLTETALLVFTVNERAGLYD